MRAFRDLIIWQKSHELVLGVYRATGDFPKQEMYGLTSQLRRAASSVPANIAEGCGRHSTADFARFLHFASGSASELEYHLMLAHDLSFMETEMFQQLTSQVIEVKRMLWAFEAKLLTAEC
ncbi:MAG TPA: four helix bundle protein [Chloroflexota bacterium]